MSASPVSHHLVTLSDDLACFHLAVSPVPPFEALRQHLIKEVGAPALAFPDIVIGLRDYARIRQSTRIWLSRMCQDSALDQYTNPGVTCPVVSKRIPASHAVVSP
jgi:hypothetical protein